MVKEHAFGLVIYELSGLVRESGMANYQLLISEKVEYYVERLLYWKNGDVADRPWAKFLVK